MFRCVSSVGGVNREDYHVMARWTSRPSASGGQMYDSPLAMALGLTGIARRQIDERAMNVSPEMGCHHACRLCQWMLQGVLPRRPGVRNTSFGAVEPDPEGPSTGHTIA